MSADKFLQLQQDVRYNQEDLKSFLRDLNTWETNIKKRDQELTDDKSSIEKNLPPVRNKKEDTKRKQRRKNKETVRNAEETSESASVNKKSHKIRAYDYRSWDKFDVNKACADVNSDDDDDDGGGRREEEDEYETDSDVEREEMEIQRRIQEANAEKDMGNTLFKNGRYEDAITCYTRGMEADSSNALLAANRAMALLKLNRFEEAEKDCDTAISLDYTYVKAYARRGAARLELGKLDDAKKDFEHVLNIETSNKQAKNAIKRIDGLLQEREEERRHAEEPSNIIQAIDKLPHLRSKKSLKRMVIQEIGKSVEEKGEAQKKERTKEMDVSTKDTCASQNNSSATTTSPSRKSEQRVQELDVRTEHKWSRSKQTDQQQSKGGRTPPGGTAKPLKPSSSVKPALPGIPTSSYQLQTDWRKMQNHPDSLLQYFKQIPPPSYPKLFQNSLDAAMLTQILTLLKEAYIPANQPLFETLEKLSTVKRFDMNVMFMSSKEKQVVRDLFDHLKSVTKDEEGRLRLAKKYGL